MQNKWGPLRAHDRVMFLFFQNFPHPLPSIPNYEVRGHLLGCVPYFRDGTGMAREYLEDDISFLGTSDQDGNDGGL